MASGFYSVNGTLTVDIVELLLDEPKTSILKETHNLLKIGLELTTAAATAPGTYWTWALPTEVKTAQCNENKTEFYLLIKLILCEIDFSDFKGKEKRQIQLAHFVMRYLWSKALRKSKACLSLIIKQNMLWEQEYCM